MWKPPWIAATCAGTLAWGCGDDSSVTDPTVSPTTTGEPTTDGPPGSSSQDAGSTDDTGTTGGGPTSSGVDTTAGDATTSSTDAHSSSSDGSGMTCGNDVIEGDELCDGSDLSGETCSSQGLGRGRLACLPDCSGFDPAGCTLGSGTLLTVRTADSMLRALDPGTLVFTDLGPLGVAFDYGDLAWDGNGGTLWMIDGRQDESLYTVDLGTGTTSLVGVHGIEDLFGLAYDTTNDTLYGSGESPSGFYVMNQMNGVAGFIGDPGIAADGLTYDSTRDQIVAIEAGPEGTLYTIDRATGVPTVLSSEGYFDNGGLAYDPDLDLYWAIHVSGSLYTYDPNAGYTRTLVIAGLPEHCGLTYVAGLSP